MSPNPQLKKGTALPVARVYVWGRRVMCGVKECIFP